SSVVNYGTIAGTGTSSSGVLLQSGGSVGNQGLIAGGLNGLFLECGIGTGNNLGTIVASATNGTGVSLASGGDIANYGLIESGGDGGFFWGRGRAGGHTRHTGVQ